MVIIVKTLVELSNIFQSFIPIDDTIKLRVDNENDTSAKDEMMA